MRGGCIAIPKQPLNRDPGLNRLYELIWTSLDNHTMLVLRLPHLLGLEQVEEQTACSR